MSRGQEIERVTFSYTPFSLDDSKYPFDNLTNWIYFCLEEIYPTPFTLSLISDWTLGPCLFIPSN